MRERLLFGAFIVAVTVLSMSKRVFVTVGTTQFESLIKSIDSIEFLQLLVNQNFDEILVQIGRRDIH